MMHFLAMSIIFHTYLFLWQQGEFLSAGETTPVIKALVQEEGSLLLDKILRVRILDKHLSMLFHSIQNQDSTFLKLKKAKICLWLLSEQIPLRKSHSFDSSLIIELILLMVHVISFFLEMVTTTWWSLYYPDHFELT